MLEPNDISVSSIQQTDFRRRLRAAVDEFQHNYLVGDAHDLYLALDRTLSNPALARAEEVKEAIGDDFIVLMYLAFPLLDEAPALRLLEKHLLLALRRGVIIEELIGRRLRLYRDVELDSVLVRKIVETISHNTEEVRTHETKVGESVLTVAEWIKKLLGTHSSTKAISTLEIIQFLESQTVLSHAPNLKDMVRRLLMLFARVQSVFLTGLLDVLFTPLLEHYALEDAESELIKSPAKKPGINTNVETLSMLKNLYARYWESRAPVLEIEDRLMATTQGDVQKIKRILSAASRERDTNTLVAALKLLAREGALVPALQSSPAWLQAVAEYVDTKYRGASAHKDRARWVASIRAGAVNIPLVSEFLQYLLKEKIGLSENASALVGVELGKLLGHDYEPIAYGNQETGTFMWSTFRLEGGKLIPEK
ncbi:MAG: hypothetical protein HZC01_01395 [Candidatus Kerfeldbacteria bacterium]|nr:hypothetical protein [Candidatus Kerfeldbacteria bacterium]